MDLGERIKLIVDHREVLEKAKADYDQAKQAFTQAKNSFGSHPGGNFAVSQAARRERQAFQVYQKALASFNQLIVDGKTSAAKNET